MLNQVINAFKQSCKMSPKNIFKNITTNILKQQIQKRNLNTNNVHADKFNDH